MLCDTCKYLLEQDGRKIHCAKRGKTHIRNSKCNKYDSKEHDFGAGWVKRTVRGAE